ncbi:hypothetical protein [Thalassospira sp. A3_1]|uniref:hypothetical protein n=1 Tax=Thalassospira sp. A3_1 TaxID=2821088 RepID=UPI001ADBB3BE|nr:hypothetical protein [Thalassospira sp. A3_1]MBO9508018.1 hypothetical protein [Thalassospira sp. A3_1]
MWHEGLDSRVRGNDGLGEGRASRSFLLREVLRMGQRIVAGRMAHLPSLPRRREFMGLQA